jgi:hypothetical protein
MRISQVKEALNTLDRIEFVLPDGSAVPNHFHVTEVGKVTKNFIDCGGTVRREEAANFQLWNADDVDHRLQPSKLMDIIALSEQILGLEDLDIEVEYQAETIGKFGLEFDGAQFLLTTTETDCLAKDQCGIEQKPAVAEPQACNPSSGCC